MGKQQSVLSRLMASVQYDRATGCLVWHGMMTHDGYGRISIAWKKHLTHRVAYELLVGNVPEGMFLDHLCRNRACINPAHLEVVTFRENVLRGISFAAVNSKKTHCNNGHPLEAGNLYVRPNGGRTCRRCNADAVARLRLRRAA